MLLLAFITLVPGGRERYALLMRANKPKRALETAVQSLGPFSPGTTWFIHHMRMRMWTDKALAIGVAECLSYRCS